jgi:tetratricopeptide (TPR) repeat protein
MLRQARVEVEKGLTSSVHPKDSFYALLLSILQQQNDMAGSAELIELVLKQAPSKAQFWPVLMASYLNISNELEKKDPTEAKSYLIRAIVTMERAQALGFMKSSKDNMNLVSLYLTAGQFSIATDFLYKAMKSGAVESEPKNWLVLGYYYQQANQELTAINVLGEAAKLFPTNGQIELTIGEIYRQLERTKDAYTHYQEAVRRGNLEKPALVYQLLAYAAFELEEFDEALKAVTEAGKFPGAEKDSQLKNLKGAIQGAIQEREYNREQAAKKAKSVL